MKNKILLCILSLLCICLISACSGEKASVADSNNLNESLDKAIVSAIFDAYAEMYASGECQGVGYKVFEIFQENDELSVYALINYIEYGFQDNLFVNVSGVRTRVLLNFKQNDSHTYTLMNFTDLDSFPGLPDDELEQLLAPLAQTGKDYTYTDDVFREIRSQADLYAKEYLKSIGRNAIVCERVDHSESLLTTQGVNEDLYNILIKNETTQVYPDWNGSIEQVENGIRYVYQTTYDSTSKKIEYSKIEYSTGRIIEEVTVDTLTGEIKKDTDDEHSTSQTEKTPKLSIEILLPNNGGKLNIDDNDTVSKIYLELTELEYEITSDMSVKNGVSLYIFDENNSMTQSFHIYKNYLKLNGLPDTYVITNSDFNYDLFLNEIQNSVSG